MVILSGFGGFVVTRVQMSIYAQRRVVVKDSAEAFFGGICTVGHDHHSRMLGVAHSHSPTVVE